MTGAEPEVERPDGVLVPRPAATTMLLRDVPSGMEVLLLRRADGLVFVGGVHAFPGGAVDESDRDPGYAAVCDGVDEASASNALGIESGGLAYVVAAVRECLEEIGLPLVVDASGSAVPLDDKRRVHLLEQRTALEQGTVHLLDLLVGTGLRLDVGGLRYVNHFITPRGLPRRYDTRFFAAVVEPDTAVGSLNSEFTEYWWARPAEALAALADNRIQMIAVTTHNLGWLEGLGSTPEVLEDASMVARRESGARLVADGRSLESPAPRTDRDES